MFADQGAVVNMGSSCNTPRRLVHLYFVTPQLNATTMLEEALAENHTFQNKGNIPGQGYRIIMMTCA